MENNLLQADTVLIDNKIYYSEQYIKDQMSLEYSRGYSDCAKNNTVIHKDEIIKCTNCANK